MPFVGGKDTNKMANHQAIRFLFDEQRPSCLRFPFVHHLVLHHLVNIPSPPSPRCLSGDWLKNNNVHHLVYLLFAHLDNSSYIR